MPCEKYTGAQRRACFASNEWEHPEKLTRVKKKKREEKGMLDQIQIRSGMTNWYAAYRKLWEKIQKEAAKKE